MSKILQMEIWLEAEEIQAYREIAFRMDYLKDKGRLEELAKVQLWKISLKYWVSKRDR